MAEYKKIKTVFAILIVAVISLFFLYADIKELGTIQYLFIYIGGAVFGLVASIATIVIMKRRGAEGRAFALVLTIVILAAGLALFYLPPICSLVFGAAQPQFPRICIHFALGYFTVGLLFDAHRVFRKRCDSG